MIVGITGTMAAGKSTLSQKIKDMGYPIYDTDKMVHHYYEPNGVLYKDLIKTFGQDILAADKQIDRQKLAKLVFSSHDNLNKLEKLVFPTVLKEMNELAGNRDTLIFFEVPLLFEAGMEDFFDKIIVVDANQEVRIQRAMQRGLSRQDVLKRMARQWPAEKKRAKADFVLDNSGDLKSFEKEIEDLLDIILFERSRLWMNL